MDAVNGDVVVPIRIPLDWQDMMGWLGLYLVADDVEDLGDFDRVHHWQIGAAMLAASLLGIGE